MLERLGLSGQPLSGADIGGIAGNATPKPFGWLMGVGAMFPFILKRAQVILSHGLLGRDPTDPGLRTTENSFLLGPLLVYSSTIADQGMDKLHPLLPKGIWLRFDDLPTLYLQGGSIIPLPPSHQHVGEANLSDD
ncbi:unnamed protein product [Dovyalis caffra]|uniref:Uncharacterized protein n=1 Tax=Dovyalis caffra TaxID=77055 RepID=A0AAV1R3W5_9ROSI|nr:unnamed protein product [Dovyalis caffra]